MRRRSAWVASIAIAALLGVGAAAPPSAEEQLLTYSVAVEDSNQFAGGTATEAITVACASGECRLLTFPRLFGLTDAAPAFVVPGALRFASEAVGGSCDAVPAGPFDVDLEFTESGVSGSAQKAEWSIACADGELTSLAQTVRVEGELVDGACYFTAEGCGADLPTPTADAAAGGADPGAGGVATPEPAEAGDRQDASGDGVGGGATTSRLASGDPAAPSVLSALPVPAEAGIAPQQLTLAALITVILVLLMTFPTSLLNSAIEGAGDRFAAWRRRRGATASAPAWQGTWWWAALGVLAASVISAFIDPQFGANPGSLRVLASIAASFAVEVVLGWVVLLWLMRRILPEATRTFSFKPLSLVVVIGAVVFTRVTGFEPGIVFGLVAGLGFAATVGVAAKARTTLVPLAYAFALAIAAWLAYGAVASSSGESLGMTLLVETLASLTVGGIVALPLALVPVKGLGGHAVWQADRRLWAVSYGIGLLAFFVVLMPLPFSWAEVGWELWAWIGVYVAYAAVAVTAWAVVKRPWRADRGAGADAPSAETSAPSPVPQPEETR